MFQYVYPDYSLTAYEFNKGFFFHFSESGDVLFELNWCMLLRPFTFELTRPLGRLSLQRKVNSRAQKLVLNVTLKPVRKLKIYLQYNCKLTFLSTPAKQENKFPAR